MATFHLSETACPHFSNSLLQSDKIDYKTCSIIKILYSNQFVAGFQMVWNSNGGLKTRLKIACLWSVMSGIQMVHQVTVLYYLNIGHPYCSVFRCLVFRWLLYYVKITINLKTPIRWTFFSHQKRLHSTLKCWT